MKPALPTATHIFPFDATPCRPILLSPKSRVFQFSPSGEVMIMWPPAATNCVPVQITCASSRVVPVLTPPQRANGSALAAAGASAARKAALNANPPASTHASPFQNHGRTEAAFMMADDGENRPFGTINYAALTASTPCGFPLRLSPAGKSLK